MSNWTRPYMLLTFLLLPFFPLAAQDIQLKMDIVGWSRDGVFCWREESTREGVTRRFLNITDLVTDEVLFSGLEPAGSADRASLLKKYAIEDDKGRANGGSRLVYDGALYETELFIESDRVSVRLKNTARGTMKEVNASPLGGDSMEIKGTVISPYEKRAALVFLRTGNGRAGYVVMGAHLTLGFAPIPLEEEELIDSVLNGQYYICRLILSEGKEPDSVKDGRGYTPLLLAVRNDKWRIAELLLEYGANAAVRDDEGKSPADYARAAGKNDLIKLME